MKLCAPTAFAASIIFSSDTSTWLYLMFSRTVPEKRNGSWSTMLIWLARDARTTSRTS